MKAISLSGLKEKPHDTISKEQCSWPDIPWSIFMHEPVALKVDSLFPFLLVFWPCYVQVGCQD